MSFLSFILRDPRYYNVKTADVRKVTGNVSKYAEFGNILIGCAMGPIFDIFGRKKILISLQVMTGVSFLLFPMFNEVYPWFLILKTAANVGVV